MGIKQRVKQRQDGTGVKSPKPTPKPDKSPLLEDPPAKRAAPEPTIAETPRATTNDEGLGPKVADPGSGVFDETIFSGQEPMPPPSPLAKFIKDLRDSKDVPLKERIASADRELDRISKQLGAQFNMGDLQRMLADAKRKDPRSRTKADRDIIEIQELVDLRAELHGQQEAVDNEVRLDKVRLLQNGIEGRRDSDRPDPDLGTKVGPPISLQHNPANAPLPLVEGENEMQAALVLDSKAREAGKEDRSPLLRAFTNRYAWGLGLITAYTGALLYTDSFQKLARTAEWLWNSALNRPPIQVATSTVVAVYGIAIGSIFVLSEVGRRVRARREAQAEQRKVETDRSYAAARKYVVEKLSEILRSHDTVQAQQDALVSAMKNNEKLLTYLDLFSRKYPETLEGIFSEVNMPQQLTDPSTFSLSIYVASKDVLMKKYFVELVPLLDSPKERMHKLKTLYEGNPFFTIKADQLFDTTSQDLGLYKGLEKVRFDYEGADKQPVMPVLLKRLSSDYQRMFQEETNARK